MANAKNAHERLSGYDNTVWIEKLQAKLLST